MLFLKDLMHCLRGGIVFYLSMAFLGGTCTIGLNTLQMDTRNTEQIGSHVHWNEGKLVCEELVAKAESTD